MLPARSLSPHFSHLTFHPPQLPQLLFHLSITPSVTVAIFSHRGRHATAVLFSLSSPLSVSLLLLSLFDTVNKQVELAVIVDASAEVPGNE